MPTLEENEKRLQELGATEDELRMLMDGGRAAHTAARRLIEREQKKGRIAYKLLQDELARTHEEWREADKNRDGM